MALLKIKDLSLSIGNTEILHDIDLEIEKGEIRGVVGESGSGKSMTAFTVMGLQPESARIRGKIDFDGQDLLTADEPTMCGLRGDDLAMVFQEPMTALNPLKTIGEQVAEGIRIHRDLPEEEVIRQTEEILAKVDLPVDRFPLSRFPDELSGGQRQRVVIAIACAMHPKLLIADEPTTALDVTVQAKILELLKRLVEEFHMGLLLISHDLGVVAEVADTITIMRDGRVVDSGDALEVLKKQNHPYTAQLAEASSHKPDRKTPPVLTAQAQSAQDHPLLRVEDLTVTYPLAKQHLFAPKRFHAAIQGLSFSIYPGQTMALIGESGCGKSTLARTILGLQAPTKGAIYFQEKKIAPTSQDNLQAARQDMQIVFQDPYGSFNPRHKVGRLVTEPLYLDRSRTQDDKTRAAAEALLAVGLGPEDLDKYAHEFSGGQRQRIAIARALVNRPKLIIADEPVSALDVSIRAQILDLLSELRDRFEIAYLFISHDLSVVRAFCDEVMIMKDGAIIERNSAQAVFENASSPYTRQLIDAAPDLEKILQTSQ